MFRLEIIIDQSIEDILLEALEKELKIEAYSHYSSVKGTGFSGPKRGDEVWPEENCVFVIYGEEELLISLKKIIKELREGHPKNGIGAFICRDAEVI